MIKGNGTNANTVGIIDANMEKIALIESKMKSQNINLKNEVSLISKPVVDEVRDDSEQTQQTIKENSGLLNSLKRFLGEIKEFLSRPAGQKEFLYHPAEQVETKNNVVSSDDNIKSMNNQLVKISMLRRDKNLESAEKSNDSVLNKVSCKEQGTVAFENKDNADKISR